MPSLVYGRQRRLREMSIPEQTRGGAGSECARIEATYRVVTPLFCAGTSPERPEFRLPSFKGVLRFWWRALAWSRCGGDLKAIQNEEAALFGSSEGGRSRVSMHVARTSEPRVIRKGQVLRQADGRDVGHGARYLGYGVMEAFGSRNRNTRSGQLIRACIRAPFEVTVRIAARALHGQEMRSLTDAMIALGTLGGMGARSRKGYGSLAIRSLSVNDKRLPTPQTVDDLRKAIASLRGRATAPPLPEFSALSPDARHVLLESDRKDALELLDLIGRELVRFRSWGRNGKILGGDVCSEKRFQPDHDLMAGSLRDAHPERIAFGLPHNYSYSSGPDKRDKRDMRVEPSGDLDRRASPLFIHVHECKGMPVAVVSFLPARFLPPQTQIAVGRGKVAQVPEDRLYRPVREFLDRLLDPNQRREPFTRALEVK